MKIRELLEGIDVLAASPGVEDADVARLTCDSRDVSAGALFVAVRGAVKDGHRYIPEVIGKRPAAIVLDDPAFLPKETPAPFLLVKDSGSALGRLAAAFFGYPYRRVKCVGITGTNGKTTVSYLVKSVLAAAGIKCGLIGTIGYKIDNANVALLNTTPGLLELHALIQKMAEAGDAYVAMEVSSHALDQERVRGIVFKSAIFTNLTQDHLDYHKTMESYFLAKKRLFEDFSDPATDRIINGDDVYGRRLLETFRGRALSYGFSEKSDVRVLSYGLADAGSRAVIKAPSGEIEIETPLVGQHNLSNVLAAVAFGISQGFDLREIKRGVEGVLSVPGRLERVESRKGFSVFVDYAHTDDALKNVLESLRTVLHNGRIITVFGCGGDRDKGKRPLMGRVASRLSDFCLVTSDNPRSEDPRSIIAAIVAGMEKDNFKVEADRAAAIREALSLARRGDIVLVAGKGHEATQQVGDKTFPFDDKAVVTDILSEIEQHV